MNHLSIIEYSDSEYRLEKEYTPFSVYPRYRLVCLGDECVSLFSSRYYTKDYIMNRIIMQGAS